MRKNTLTPYFLLLPLFILFVVILFYPWGLSFWYSLHLYKPMYGTELKFNGFENYIAILTDPVFYRSLAITGYFMLGAVSLEMVLGLLIANTLDSIGREKIKKAILIALIVPMMCATVYIALTMRLIFHPIFGVVNYILSLLGIPPQDWYGDPQLSVPLLVFTDVFQNTGFVVLVLFAGLQALPRDWIEAAMIDGASSWNIFRYIKLPFLKPLIMIALFFRVIITLRIFETPLILFSESGGPGNAAQVLGIYLYHIAFKSWDLGMASALSWMMVLLSLGLTIAILLALYREVRI